MQDDHTVRTTSSSNSATPDKLKLHRQKKAAFSVALKQPFEGPSIIVTHHLAVRYFDPKWPL